MIIEEAVRVKRADDNNNNQVWTDFIIARSVWSLIIFIGGCQDVVPRDRGSQRRPARMMIGQELA